MSGRQLTPAVQIYQPGHRSLTSCCSGRLGLARIDRRGHPLLFGSHGHLRSAERTPSSDEGELSRERRAHPDTPTSSTRWTEAPRRRVSVGAAHPEAGVVDSWSLGLRTTASFSGTTLLVRLSLGHRRRARLISGPWSTPLRSAQGLDAPRDPRAARLYAAMHPGWRPTPCAADGSAVPSAAHVRTTGSSSVSSIAVSRPHRAGVGHSGDDNDVQLTLPCRPSDHCGPVVQPRDASAGEDQRDGRVALPGVPQGPGDPAEPESWWRSAWPRPGGNSVAHTPGPHGTLTGCSMRSTPQA